MSIRLNPLSAARGAKLQCELCGQPSTLACAHCRVTYYCSKEHQSIDWAGIHERICTTVASLRNPPESFNTEEERHRRQLAINMNQQALIELSKNEASKFLVQGQFELSIPPALQCLKLSTAVYGKGRIELVPSYLLLAEANMGLRRFAQAENFLLLAQWGIFKDPKHGHAIKSQLYRLYGKNYLAQGLLGPAAEHLVQDIYYSSLQYGSEHYHTAAGYYQMGLIFLKQDLIDNCLAFLDKVVDIWFKFLSNFKQQPREISISSVLSDAVIGEAADILRSVIETRVEFLGNGHIATGEASYVLGMLCQLTGHKDKALELLSSALGIYEVHVGSDHDLTKQIRMALADAEGNTGLEKKQNIAENSVISVPS